MAGFSELVPGNVDSLIGRAGEVVTYAKCHRFNTSMRRKRYKFYQLQLCMGIK